MGSLKAKLGLRGKTKPGEMIARMNALKTKNKHKFDMAGIKNTIVRGEQAIGNGLKFAGNIGKAFVRNAMGGDIKSVLKKKTRKKLVNQTTPSVSPTLNRSIKSYPPPAQRTINQGLRTGNVRFEPSSTGGEYIYSGDKSFGKKKTKKR